MRKLLKKSMAAVLTASMAMSMTACAGKAVKPGSEESEAKTSEAAAANVETSEAAGEEGLTTEDITLTISWWGGESRHEATQKAIEAFMKNIPILRWNQALADGLVGNLKWDWRFLRERQTILCRWGRSGILCLAEMEKFSTT